MMQVTGYPGCSSGAEFSTPDGCADLNTLLFREDFDILHLHWIANFLNTDALLHTGIRTGVLGHVDDVAQTALVYNAADAVLVTSLEDNAPNVICEAAGCGVPIIAFAAGGIPEMVRHKETGRLAPAADVGSLVEGVHWPAAAREDRMLPLRCRAFALERWNPAALAAEYAALYRDALCGKREI
jgi:glycosyltransferase involved in cell wall biosynthesis